MPAYYLKLSFTLSHRIRINISHTIDLYITRIFRLYFKGYFVIVKNISELGEDDSIIGDIRNKMVATNARLLKGKKKTKTFGV